MAPAASCPSRLWQWLAVGAACLMPCLAGAQNLYRLDIPFRDDAGRTVRLSEWNGRNAIVTMEYSTCSFMCSTTLYKLRQTQTAADERKDPIDFIVISLEPRNDTPESWQRYRRQRDLMRGNWHFLTAGEKDVPTIARLLDIHYWYEGSHLLHDFRLLRTDAAGDVVRSIAGYDADVNTLLN